MSRISIWGKVLPLAAGLSCPVICGILACAPRELDSGPTNVILIVADTLRADAVFDGEGGIRHPNLDALAQDGVAFEQCFSHAPMTLPSHTTMLSSQLPFESGVLKNGDDIPADLPLLTEHLGRHGYATAAAFSINALGGSGDVKLGRGFDEIVYSRGPITWADETSERVFSTLDSLELDEDPQPFFLFAHYAEPHHPYRSHGLVEHTAQVSLDGEPLTEISTSMSPVWETTLELRPGTHTVDLSSAAKFNVISFRAFSNKARVVHDFRRSHMKNKENATIEVTVKGSRSVPVKLSLWLNDTHDREEKLARYQAEVAHFDQFLGDLVADLKARGLYDSSMIVFTSDHGEGLFDHDVLGHSTDVFDELINVPLIIKLPKDHVNSRGLGMRRDELVRHVDLAPTILDALGLPADRNHHGISLFDDAERLLVAEAHKPFAPADLVCIRDQRYKLIYDADADSFTMYDLYLDPGEKQDRYEQDGELRQHWEATLRSIASAGLERNQTDELDEETRESLAALGYVAQ